MKRINKQKMKSKCNRHKPIPLEIRFGQLNCSLTFTVLDELLAVVETSHCTQLNKT